MSFTLIYLGMQDQYYTFNMFDAQAWVARDVILGRTGLPDTEIMRAHSEEWFARENACAGVDDDIDFQAAYVRDLVDRSDYPDFRIEEVAEMFKQWQHDKREDILGYRNKRYRSTITGTLAPPHHTPWMKAMDDTLEAFLRESRELEEQPTPGQAGQDAVIKNAAAKASGAAKGGGPKAAEAARDRSAGKAERELQRA